MSRRDAWILGLAVTAVAVTIAGLWTARSAMTAHVGWFAFAPLTDSVELPGYPTGRLWAGWVATALGLMLLSGLGGYLLGSRRPSQPSR